MNAYFVDGGDISTYGPEYERACGIVIAATRGRAKVIFMRETDYPYEFTEVRAWLMMRDCPLPEGWEPEPPEGPWMESDDCDSPEPWATLWAWDYEKELR